MSELVLALTVGSIYSMLAIGLVMTYRVTNTINFAHGAIATLGAYIMLTFTAARGGGAAGAYSLNWFMAYPIWTGLVVAVIAGMVVSWILYYALFVFARSSSPLSIAVVTMGLMVALMFACLQIWTDTVWLEKSVFPKGSITLSGVAVTYHQIGILATLALVTLILFVWLTRTRSGVASRAVVEDPMAAELVGLDVRRVQLGVWVVSGGLAALAGCLIAPVTTLSPLTMTGVMVKALAAAIVGRLVSLPPAVLGGFLIAYVEAWATQRWTRPGVGDGITTLLVIGALLLQSGRQGTLRRLVRRLQARRSIPEPAMSTRGGL